MKILITTDWYKPVVNGVVTSVINLKTELEKKGHEVRILTLSNNNISRQKNKIYYMKSFSADKIYPHARASFFVQNDYLKNIIEWHPDIIHSQCEFSTFIYARKLAKRLDIPLVHTYHTIYEDYAHYLHLKGSLEKKAAQSISKYILNKAAFVVAPTKKVMDLLIEYGVKTEINIIPTGIELIKYNTVPTDRWKINTKKLLKIPEENYVLVIVGRLAEEKNIDEIIDFINKINDKSISLLIVGDGPHRKHLEQTVKNLELNKNVIFTGMIPPKEVQNYYHLGDIFVNASSSESQGLTCLEAVACGLPCVCKKDPCIENVIIDGYNGFQYDSYETFHKSIEFILKDSENYNCFSENAKKIAEQNSTLIFANRIEALYKKLIQQKFTEQNIIYRKTFLRLLRKM